MEIKTGKEYKVLGGHKGGDIIKITKISGNRAYYKPIENNSGYAHLVTNFDLCSVFAHRLEEVKPETIVIYRKDNKVIALDKSTGKKAIARRCPEDTFDFNTGARLAFERLMNSNEEIRTVDDMRKNLEKIKAAFNIVFGTGIKEVKRRAKQGEYVKIVDAILSYKNYKNGDILRIVDDTHGHVRYGHNPGEVLFDYEYVVLEGYKPDEPDEPKKPHKFKVGDIVKGNLESDKVYYITNSDMTRGKIICVTGDIITIEVLNHKTLPDKAGKEYDVESKYFDLVEEGPKLYNGKIIFTKGDDTFKTGHIYEIKDGKIMLGDRKLPYEFNGGVFCSIEDVRKFFDKDTPQGWDVCTLELIEVVDD